MNCSGGALVYWCTRRMKGSETAGLGVQSGAMGHGTPGTRLTGSRKRCWGVEGVGGQMGREGAATVSISEVTGPCGDGQAWREGEERGETKSDE